MELLIQKNTFLRGLQRIQGVVDSKKAIPILSNVLIECAKEGIWIYATDLEVGIKGFYQGKVKGEGSFILPARKLFDIVRELPNEEIQMVGGSEADGQENWVTITCGKYTSRLPCMAADVYPSFPSYGDDCLVHFDSGVLKDMIRKTVFSISTDESRLALNGTLLEIEDDFVTFVSTDGHRLSCIKRKNPEKCEKNQTVILSRKTSTELLKFVEDADEPVQFSIYENHAVFKRGTIVLVARLLIEGQFPNYKAVIPDNNHKRAIIEKDRFIHALRRVSLLSEEKSRMVKLTLDKGQVELLSNASEIGEASEQLKAEYEDDQVSIGLNAKYVLEILGSMDETKVVIALNNSTSPAMFLPVDDEDDYKCVIMPVRLQS